MIFLVAALIHLNVGDCTQSINEKDASFRKIVDITANEGNIYYTYQMANIPTDVKRHLFNVMLVEEFENLNNQVECPKWFQ